MSSESIIRRHLKFANKLFCRDCKGQLTLDDFKAVPLVCRDALYNNVHCANWTRLCWLCDGPTPATLNKVLNRDVSTEEESPLEESGKSHTPPPVSSDSSLPSEMVVISDDGDEEAIVGCSEVDSSRGTSPPFVVYADFEPSCWRFQKQTPRLFAETPSFRHRLEWKILLSLRSSKCFTRQLKTNWQWSSGS